MSFLLGPAKGIHKCLPKGEQPILYNGFCLDQK
jgi:hypothetical protein